MTTTPNISNNDRFDNPSISSAAVDPDSAACIAFLETFLYADEHTRQAMFQAPVPWTLPDPNPTDPPNSSGPACERPRPEAGTPNPATQSACAKCGSARTDSGGGPLLDVLCIRCYVEAPYSSDRAWEVPSEARVQAALKSPVVKNGVPFLCGAVPTERAGWCWTCGASTPAGSGEVVWEPIDACQHALCTACVWRSTYDGLWPEMTPEQAVGVAAQRLPLRVLAMAAFLRGYTVEAVVGGAITQDVRARLSADADAHDAAASQDPVATDTRTHLGHLPPEVRVGTDARTFHGYLPPELVGWHEYVLDSGHCIHAVLAQHAADHRDEELLGWLVPLPVGLFGWCHWEVRAGFVIVHGLTYDDHLGVLGCLPSDEFW